MCVAGVGKGTHSKKEGRRESQSVRSDDLDAVRLQGRGGGGGGRGCTLVE